MLTWFWTVFEGTLIVVMFMGSIALSLAPIVFLLLLPMYTVAEMKENCQEWWHKRRERSRKTKERIATRKRERRERRISDLEENLGITSDKEAQNLEDLESKAERIRFDKEIEKMYLTYLADRYSRPSADYQAPMTPMAPKTYNKKGG